MKRVYLIAIILIVGAIAMFTMAAEDMSTYGNFIDAQKSGKVVKIAAQLSKDKEMYYNPEEDPNYFSFYATDDKGIEHKVVLLQEKPQDFELSEQIVLTGSVKGDAFVATDILMKCPSKYKDEEVYMKNEMEG